MRLSELSGFQKNAQGDVARWPSFLVAVALGFNRNSTRCKAERLRERLSFLGAGWAGWAYVAFQTEEMSEAAEASKHVALLRSQFLRRKAPLHYSPFRQLSIFPVAILSPEAISTEPWA